MSEVWKPIKNYERYYHVSNLGRVRSLDRYQEIRSKVKILRKGRILKPKMNKSGYLTVKLSLEGNVKCKFIHRLVAENFISEYKKPLQVNHVDGNKLNNKVSNLEWVTASENIQHSFDIKLREGYKSEKHPMSKLSNIETDFIRYWLDLNFKGNLLANLFDVSCSTISEIKNNKRRLNV